MTLLELPTQSLADLVAPPTTVRSPGLHLSTIIQDILTDLDPKKYGQEMDWNRVQAGVTFERILERELISRNPNLIRPGERVRDGVACSLDGWDPVDRVVEEYKWTWKSSRYPITDDRFWGWMVQIKGYCHVMETPLARLRVFFVNGDYSAFTPEFRSWALSFTPQELADNWAMVTQPRPLQGVTPQGDHR